MIPDQVRNLYYLSALVIAIGSVGASYFATRAANATALSDIIRRLGVVERSLNTFQTELAKLTRTVGYLEGRINGRDN